jgi:beta-barrel assembly-enhancing protease
VRLRPSLGPLALLVLALSACAPRVSPIGTGLQPFSPDPDERLLWAQAEREVAAIVQRVRVYEDPALAAYLAGLAERLTPDAVRAAGGPPLRFTVLRDPTLNAFALPDGHVFVHTGLLAAVDSEAQLALILGRELAHVVQRHALVVARQGRGAPARYEGAAALGPTAGAILGTEASLAIRAAVTGYGDRLERQADAAALASVARGGWNARQAAAVYAVLERETRECHALEAFLLGTPTRLRARREAMAESIPAATPPLSPAGTSDEFQAHHLRVTRENALADIGAGRFALARRQLDRVLAATPGDAAAHAVDGDLHRLRAQRASSAAERDAFLEQARRSYERALALDPTGADAHRRLGLLYYQQRDTVRAAAELREYLRLAADAPDVARIAEYVRELERR